jgi:hypothetical protein
MAKTNPFMEMIAKKKAMAKGKKEGMHKMPDGKMMKDSAMKSGGKVKKMAAGGGMMKAKMGMSGGIGEEVTVRGSGAARSSKARIC